MAAASNGRRLDISIRVTRLQSGAAGSQRSDGPTRDVTIATGVLESSLPVTIALSRKDKPFDGASHVLCLGEDKEVSTRHAVVTISPSSSAGVYSLSVVDVGSTNGTHACDRRLAPHTPCDITCSPVVVAGSSRCELAITVQQEEEQEQALPSLLCAPARGDSVASILARFTCAAEAVSGRVRDMTPAQVSSVSATLARVMDCLQAAHAPAVPRPRKRASTSTARVPVSVPHAGTVTAARAGGKRGREHVLDVMHSRSITPCALCAAFGDSTATVCTHTADSAVEVDAQGGSGVKRAAEGVSRLWALTADAGPRLEPHAFHTTVLEPASASTGALPEPEASCDDLTLPRACLPHVRRCMTSILAPVAQHVELHAHLESTCTYLITQPFRALMEGRSRMARDRLTVTDPQLQLQLDLSMRMCDLLSIVAACGAACIQVEHDRLVLTAAARDHVARLSRSRLQSLCAVFGVDSNRMEGPAAVEAALACLHAWLQRAQPHADDAVVTVVDDDDVMDAVATTVENQAELTLRERVCAHIRAHPDAHECALMLEPLPVRALARTKAETGEVKAVLNELGLSYSDAWRA